MFLHGAGGAQTRRLILTSLLVLHLGCSGGDEPSDNASPNNTLPNNSTSPNNIATDRCDVDGRTLSDGDACTCASGEQGFVDCAVPTCACGGEPNNMSTPNGATNSTSTANGSPNNATTGNNADPLPRFPECTNSCSCPSGCEHRCRIECVSECAGGTCNFELNAGGRITCRAGSTCDILCESGGCEVTCEAGATCNLRCQPQAVFCDFVECGARQECGARDKACNSSC